MSRSWNGADLVTEFSTLLGDTSTAFKSKVLGWLNDVIEDISASHDWTFLKVRGKKVLTASTEIQNIFTEAPTSAPSVAISAGGSLTESSVYNVYVTYFESTTGFESKPSVASSNVTATAVNKTIDLTSVPVSPEPLVTSRKLYLQKDSGEIYYHSDISDNTTTTGSISTETTSTIEPPDYVRMEKIIGDLFLESSSPLEYRDFDQLRLLFNGTWSTGTPTFWSDIGDNQVTMYPVPSSALTLSYYYKKIPARIYDASDSNPDIPPYLKPILRAGVIAYGYEYRDRNGQESKRANYETLLRDSISKNGSKNRNNLSVRDVMGDSDGWEN
jgi:hypothetical protein